MSRDATFTYILRSLSDRKTRLVPFFNFEMAWRRPQACMLYNMTNAVSVLPSAPCKAIDCAKVCIRTEVRSLYAQMAGLQLGENKFVSN